MDLLTNPWVIIVIVLSVIIGNIAALKYTANMKFERREKKHSAEDQGAKSKQSDQESD